MPVTPQVEFWKYTRVHTHTHTPKHRHKHTNIHTNIHTHLVPSLKVIGITVFTLNFSSKYYLTSWECLYQIVCWWQVLIIRVAAKRTQYSYAGHHNLQSRTGGRTGIKAQIKWFFLLSLSSLLFFSLLFCRPDSMSSSFCPWVPLFLSPQATLLSLLSDFS